MLTKAEKDQLAELRAGAGPRYPQWEYKSVKARLGLFDLQAADYGLLGWELVAVAGRGHLIFKRAVISA